MPFEINEILKNSIAQKNLLATQTILKMGANPLALVQYPHFKEKILILEIALIKKSPEILYTLLNYISAEEINDKLFERLIFISAEFGFWDGVLLLCKYKNKNILDYINATDEHKQTLLHFFCAQGTKNAVEFLIKNNADINCANYRGITPLMAAVNGNHKKIVEILLEKGAETNLKEIEKNRTALYNACEIGNLNIVKILIEYGAEINLLDFWNFAPIHIAVFFNHKEVVEFLIQNGANISVKTIYEETPLDIARRRNNKDIENVLLAALNTQQENKIQNKK